MESPTTSIVPAPRLRLRWALIGGLWADVMGGAVFTAFFAAANDVVEPFDCALLMAYGAVTCAVVLLPVNLALGLLARRIAARRRDRPPDEILTTAMSLHFAVLVAGYGLSSRASEWWFYERAASGLLSAANLRGLAVWGAGAVVLYAAAQAVWRLRRNIRLRNLCATLTLACGLSPFARPALPASPPAPTTPAIRLPPPDTHVLWIGIDGADWRLLDPLIADGSMPELAALCRRGARGPLASLPPYASQPCWVTAATGATPAVHGVGSRLVARFPGVRPFVVNYRSKEFLPVYGTGLLLLELGGVELLPTPRSLWHAEPLWGCLSRVGRRSAIIGWPATWPADRIDGLIVTDRFYHSVWEAFYQRPKPGLPASLHPPEWMERARALRVDPREHPDATAARLFDPAPDLLRRFRAPRLDPLDKDPVAYLGRGVAMDLTDLAIAGEALREGGFDLVAPYTTGFDLAAHGFWIELEPGRFDGGPPSGRPELKNTLPRYCRFLDEQIGALVRRAPADAVVILSSDHGVTPSPHHPVWPVAHDATGILVMAGPPIRPGARIEGARLLDLAATVAFLLSAPAPAQNEGRVLQEWLTPAFLAGHPGAGRHP